MTTLTTYGQALDHLTSALGKQPYLALLLSVSQLDPFYTLDVDLEDYYWDDPLPMAIQIVRQYFLPVYCEMLVAWRKGMTLEELSEWLCQALSAQLYTPLHSLEQVLFGPPVNGYGLDWGNLDDLTDPQKVVVHMLGDAFGISAENDSADFHHAYQVGEVLVLSLEMHPDLEPIARALQWVLAISGNTLVDCTDEAIAEMGHEPFDWTPEDLEFLAEIHTEAEQVVASANEGLTQLAESPKLLELLLQNTQHLMREMPRRKYHVERHDLIPYTRGCEWTYDSAPTPQCPTSVSAEIL